MGHRLPVGRRPHRATPYPAHLRHRGDLVTRAPSPGQTVGPFFHFALPYDGDDALVEVWQADPDGTVVQSPGSLRRDGSTFTGFGRCATDPAGRYSFSTLTPGGVDGGLPFFAIAVFARGLLHRLLTRAYLPLPPGVTDPVLTSAGDRAATLVCVADDEGLQFDIRLQGDRETVFLTSPG